MNERKLKKQLILINNNNENQDVKLKGQRQEAIMKNKFEI